MRCFTRSSLASGEPAIAAGANTIETPPIDGHGIVCFDLAAPKCSRVHICAFKLLTAVDYSKFVKGYRGCLFLTAAAEERRIVHGLPLQ